jgi:hypothetical protein
LSRGRLCVGLITRPGESYRLCVCNREYSSNGENGETLVQRGGGGVLILKKELKY